MTNKLAQGKRIALAPAVLAYIYTSLDALVYLPYSRGRCGAPIYLSYHFLYAWVESNFEVTYAPLNKPKDYIININGSLEIQSIAYISSVRASTFTLQRVRAY